MTAQEAQRLIRKAEKLCQQRGARLTSARREVFAILAEHNSFVLCSHFDHQHPVQMLICDSCGDVQEIQSEGVYDELKHQAEDQGFKVENQTIEAHGLCAKCHS
ncbi:MAG: transcriptional repressor [Idiomarina sp.]|nr:transcriptional repressor [Idiomarina sp.]